MLYQIILDVFALAVLIAYVVCGVVNCASEEWLKAQSPRFRTAMLVPGKFLRRALWIAPILLIWGLLEPSSRAMFDLADTKSGDMATVVIDVMCVLAFPALDFWLDGRRIERENVLRRFQDEKETER